MSVTLPKQSSSSRYARLSLLLLLFPLALFPRLFGVREAATEDEDQWIARSGNFSRALTSGSLRNTYQTGHPGVTTMWITNLSLGFDRVGDFTAAERRGLVVSAVGDFLPALRTARVSFAVLSACLAAICGLLAARLLGWGPGLLAGVLLALDPFWSAMSPIVGMDALLAGFLGASLLSMLLAFRRRSRGLGWAWLSGFLAGLALITKGPAIFLFPMLPFLVAREARRLALQDAPRSAKPALEQSEGTWLTPPLSKAACWGLGALVGVFIWPAMWADPFGTLQRTADFVVDMGARPHAPGNFFLGRPVADPGPLFYPVALALRIGPGILLGLLVLPLVGARRFASVRMLLVSIAIFALGVTVASKKLDRYILPIFPALGVLAGLAWWLLLRRLAERLGQRIVLPLGVLLVGLLQLWPLYQSWPHPLTAYNPLAGGVRAAEYAMQVGWGEGLDIVGSYLRREPNPERLVTGVWSPLRVNLQAHAPGQVVTLSFSGPGELSNPGLYERTDFYVDYIHARQRGLTPASLAGRPPDLTVRINGADYARVYRVRR